MNSKDSVKIDARKTMKVVRLILYFVARFYPKTLCSEFEQGKDQNDHMAHNSICERSHIPILLHIL